MSKIRIGVMGCANIAKRYMISAIKEAPNVELIAIASRSAEKAASFASEFGTEGLVGYQSLLKRDDIDAIYMPLPTGLHHEWISKSLKANKHVLAEKSLAINYDSAKELVDLAKERSLVLMENFQFQHHSQNAEVKRMIRDGAIGEFRVMRASFGFPPLDESNFRYDGTIGGGALLDAGAYMLKVSQFFLGEDLDVVAADHKYDSEKAIDLYGSAYLRTKDGRCAEVAWGFDNFYQCNYELWGSKGKLTATRAYTAAPGFAPTIILEQQGVVDNITLETDNHFVNILNFFGKTIEEGTFSEELVKVLDQARMISEVQNKSNEQ